MAHPLEITESTFESEVAGSDVPVLVDFWAPWCGPCRQVGPIVEEIASDYAGRLKVAKVNVDDEPELARRFAVMSIPSILLFKGGEVVATTIGARRKPGLVEALNLDNHLAKAAL